MVIGCRIVTGIILQDWQAGSNDSSKAQFAIANIKCKIITIAGVNIFVVIIV